MQGTNSGARQGRVLCERVKCNTVGDGGDGDDCRKGTMPKTSRLLSKHLWPIKYVSGLPRRTTATGSDKP